MRLYPLLLVAVIAIGIASADVSIVNDTLFNLDNSAYIKVLAPQNSTNITIYNSTGTPASALQFYINGTPIRFAADTNKTLSNISYNNATDVVTYTGNGTSGYLNVSARMNLSLRYYDLEVDGITSQTLLSGASGWVEINYTGWSPNQHEFRIKRTGAPGITSWGNNNTNDQSMGFTLNTGEFINFNATANQSIDTWKWFKDGVNQNNNYDNFTASFTSGTHTIKVNATNFNGTSNTITWNVTARAIRGASLTGISALSLPANAGTNATYILNLTNNGTDADSYNLTVDNPDAAAVGLNISAAYYFLDPGETKIFSLNVTGASAGTFKVNVTAASTNDTSKFAYVNTTTTVTVDTYIPPTPIILTNNTGNFFVNTTWQAGAGNVTDSYNVNVNGRWTNGTTNTYVNSSLSAHAWQNVSVYAFNGSGTGTLNNTPATNNTQIPNNIPVMSPIGSKNVDENHTLSFTVSTTDADGDTLTYGSNATKGAFNTGTGLFTWTPGFDDSGTYVWYFNSSDGYGGVASETVTITVNNIPLSITARTPGTDPVTAVGTVQTFTASLNRSATVTWYINGTSVQTNTGITYASYTNSTADAGIYNVTAIAQDTYDTTSTVWTWTVSMVSAGAPNITGFAPSSPVSNTEGATRTFNITVNQTVNVTWYINGTLKKTDTGVTGSSYTNTSATLGVWNVTATANNANGAVSQEWLWNVTEAPTGVPNITNFAPSSPVSNTEGATRTFNITVNQTVNVTWYINGTLKKTDTGVTGSSYTNTSATLGVWNVTAIADNTNGAVSKLWIWNVTAAPEGVPNITGFTPSSPISNIAVSSRNFKLFVNQAVNVTWYINGTTVFNETNVTESSYTNTSAALGTWNVTATANNTNGTISQQWTWIVTAESVQPPALPLPIPVPGGGGGGGAGVISPEPLSNIEQYEIMEEYLGANVPTSYILTTPDIVISEVLITPAKNFGITSIRVELLKDLSGIEGITQPSGTVYKYANIWVGAKELEGEEGVIDAYIGFRVETSWLVENNLEDNSVKLLRWDGSKWVSLETTPKDRDDNFVYYESKTIGFSPFAIVAVPQVPSAAVGKAETPTIDAVIQKIVKQMGEPGLSVWVYIFIALVLGGLLVYSLVKIKNAVNANQPPSGVLKSDTLVKIKKAMRFSDEDEKITPEDETAWYNKGIAFYESGNYEEAIKAYDKAIEINPEYTDAWYNKGIALYELGRKSYDKAREIIHKKRRLD